MKIEKRFVIVSAAFLLFVLSAPHSFHANPTPPSYAKWGQVAVKTGMEKYPNAKIVDYLHIGRENRANSSIEKFKLWLKENGKEFGLFINIEFDPKNDRVIAINIRESES